MADGDSDAWFKRALDSLSGINTVFALLVFVILILGVALWRVVPKLDGSWGDTRFWLCILLVAGIGVVSATVLVLMKRDPARLLTPTVDKTTIQDSQTVSIGASTADEDCGPKSGET